MNGATAPSGVHFYLPLLLVMFLAYLLIQDIHVSCGLTQEMGQTFALYFCKI